MTPEARLWMVSSLERELEWPRLPEPQKKPDLGLIFSREDREAMIKRLLPQKGGPVCEVSFTVPLVPVSVNHYKKCTRQGHYYVTKEALAFKEAVYIFAKGRSVNAKKYHVSAKVFLGKGKRGDADNFGKLIGDGLQEARVIHSDAAIKVWTIEVGRDWENPRTEILVRGMEDLAAAWGR